MQAPHLPNLVARLPAEPINPFSLALAVGVWNSTRSSSEVRDRFRREHQEEIALFGSQAKVVLSVMRGMARKNPTFTANGLTVESLITARQEQELEFEIAAAAVMETIMHQNTLQHNPDSALAPIVFDHWQHPQ